MLSGAAMASDDQPTTTLLPPGTTPGTDDRPTHGTLTPKPVPTTTTTKAPPITVTPQYTG